MTSSVTFGTSSPTSLENVVSTQNLSESTNIPIESPQLPESKINGINISSHPPLSHLKILPYRPSPKTCMDHIRSVGEKISLFLRDNWKYILLYILAWALILACHHVMAVTLTIWLGIGLGIGVVFGIFTANVLDRKNKYKNTNSLWNLMNYGLQQLDPNGTRQILLATIIASISSLIYAIPEAVGFTIGACIGNQISILISYGLRLRDDDNYVADRAAFDKKVANIQKAINFYQLVKNQMIMQKQLSAIATQQNTPQMTSTLHSLQLQMNAPLPYIFDMPKMQHQDHLHFSDPDLVIASANQRILSLSQTLTYLRQEPNRVVEE
ncbi:conserved hypothetical protein [Chlamydia felis Fe/C-56]|uniref:Transmembrane protein n=1 Tax=Chlamydia felis (strain Fe/C-56) TaxID=264202 RepID=Q255F5_CHLFF|nr:hypothetical protein [Chlamydia felis]BAE81083.1 conserved hypothetical protein [Chlamydia felis Fe/C-56]